MNDTVDIYAGKILIVDDNPINTSLAEAILKREGYRDITCCSVPYEVRELYRQHRYDLLLLDIHMPGLNGIELMQQLSDDFPADYLPVLVLTADTSPELRVRALAAGAKDFLTKPFDKTEVKLRARNIMQVQLMQKALRRYADDLEQKVQERTRELRESHIKLVQCLGKAAEYRDNETGQHVVRMSMMAALLGEAMGLPPHDCEMILHASPMHDIGKIGIPDRILLKPGALTPDDWERMKSHTEIGARILEDVGGDLLNTAAEIARTHHERWDGSGYPRGLKGDAIPLYTRIVTVCDVFDALLSVRPYKDSWAQSAAVDFITENSGTLFDPAVVEAFLAILPELMAIRDRHPDTRHPSAEAAAK